MRRRTTDGPLIGSGPSLPFRFAARQEGGDAFLGRFGGECGRLHNGSGGELRFKLLAHRFIEQSLGELQCFGSPFGTFTGDLDGAGPTLFVGTSS